MATSHPVSSSVRRIRASPTVAINELCDRLRSQGRQIAKLGLGQSPFPVPTTVVEALRANAARRDYLPVKGLQDLRAAVADYHRRFNKTATTADDVLISPGSKELMFLLHVVYDGEIIIPTPAWVSYAPQARIVGRPVRFVHTRREEGWRLLPDDLDRLCRGGRGVYRPRILVLNYPSNPTGMTYEAAELDALATVARAHRVVILSDEIYGELHHQGRHVSAASFYPEGTIISSGLSKWCGAGGWRLGTFAFPPALHWLMDSIAAVASETYTSTSAPIQYAAVRAFQGGIEIERYLWNTRRILSALGHDVCRKLQYAGLIASPPLGAYYVFVDFSPWAERLKLRGICTDQDLCRRLLEEEGVAILPGSEFGRPPEELTARLAYVDFDGARALGAAETVPRDQPLDESFTSAYCGHVLTAVDRIAMWGSKSGGVSV